MPKQTLVTLYDLLNGRTTLFVFRLMYV